jgi:hypothetical protein
MITVTRCASLALLALVLATAPLGAQQAASVQVLAWMAGSWAGPDKAIDHEEHWMAPRGGAMVGMHRAVRDGRMIEFEYLRIEESGGTLVYLSMPSGRSPATPFTLKEQIGERVTFENLAHDFPQRIIYWRDGDTLHTRS